MKTNEEYEEYDEYDEMTLAEAKTVAVTVCGCIIAMIVFLALTTIGLISILC